MGSYSLPGRTAEKEPCIVFYDQNTRHHMVYVSTDGKYSHSEMMDVDSIFGLRLDSEDPEFEYSLQCIINDRRI